MCAGCAAEAAKDEHRCKPSSITSAVPPAAVRFIGVNGLAIHRAPATPVTTGANGWDRVLARRIAGKRWPQAGVISGAIARGLAAGVPAAATCARPLSKVIPSHRHTASRSSSLQKPTPPTSKRTIHFRRSRMPRNRRRDGLASSDRLTAVSSCGRFAWLAECRSAPFVDNVR